MVRAAVAYLLSFPAISTLLLGRTSVSQADSNFGSIPGARLTPEALARIAALQQELGLRMKEGLLKRLWKGLIGG